MALNLKEVFAPAAIAAYWTNDPTNAMPFASDALFPAKKKAGLDLKWLRGHKGVGVSLMPSAFDAKATFRTREGFKFDETEMPFFREGYHLGEKDRQEILRVLDSNDPYARDVMNRLYDDTAQLITGARIVPERMIWQLLAPANGCGRGEEPLHDRHRKGKRRSAGQRSTADYRICNRSEDSSVRQDVQGRPVQCKREVPA